MIIYKFGGASVKSADAVRNLAYIVRSCGQPLVVVVSAMGKMTNALEAVVYPYFNRKDFSDELRKVKDYHYLIIKELFPDTSHDVYARIGGLFDELEKKLQSDPGLNYDFEYDQVVCYGELLSTLIVSEYLLKEGIPNTWKDIRKALKTDNTYREAKVDWELSAELVKREFTFSDENIFITQGFIASTINNLSTTLGREGSDYTAAILANLLDAPEVVIWKDVPGVLNADPKWFDDTILIEQLSYRDAIELAYYGVGVIHPRTIQPLKNKDIRLFVRSFIEPDKPGTLISDQEYQKLIPSFIFRVGQVLLSISSKDFSFIYEENLEHILGIFARNRLRINLMQNSAVCFQVCVNNDKTKLPALIKDLEDHFTVSWSNNLELITIRYYDDATIARVLVNKEKILEQRSKNTIQLVVRDLG